MRCTISLLARVPGTGDAWARDLARARPTGRAARDDFTLVMLRFAESVTIPLKSSVALAGALTY